MAEGILRPGASHPRPVSRRGPTPGFREPERVPWSLLGPEFIDTWSHDENGKLQAEHAEVEGQSGSGKSYAVATILQQRAERWDTGEIAVLTKNTDDSIPLLGWPVATSLQELRQWQQCVFWPRTTAKGDERERYHERVLYDLLSGLWPDPDQQANMAIYFDEVRYIEGLSRRLKKLVRMYWREGRSHGISIVAGAQRPLEMVRDMHSEARWRLVFPPADDADMERFAELLGKPADWEPVLRELDQPRHEFVIRNSFTKAAYITWIDRVLKPIHAQTEEGQEREPASLYPRQSRK